MEGEGGVAVPAGAARGADLPPSASHARLRLTRVATAIDHRTVINPRAALAPSTATPRVPPTATRIRPTPGPLRPVLATRTATSNRTTPTRAAQPPARDMPTVTSNRTT